MLLVYGYKIKPGANLKGADLTKADLRDVNLTGANLKGAELQQSRLDRAKLEEANLKRAILTEANLTDARLDEANLKRANLAGAILKSASLTGANIKNGYLVRADLQGADLTGTNLKGVNLREANLEGAYLDGAKLNRETNLEGANLKGAHLRVDFKGASLEGADLTGANLLHAKLEGLELGAVEFKGADFGRASLKGAYLDGANLENANLQEANLEGVSLRGANLKGANLTGVNLKDVVYDERTVWPDGIDVKVAVELLADKFYEAAVKETKKETPFRFAFPNVEKEFNTPLVDEYNKAIQKVIDSILAGSPPENPNKEANTKEANKEVHARTVIFRDGKKELDTLLVTVFQESDLEKIIKSDNCELVIETSQDTESTARLSFSLKGIDLDELEQKYVSPDGFDVEAAIKGLKNEKKAAPPSIFSDKIKESNKTLVIKPSESTLERIVKGDNSNLTIEMFEGASLSLDINWANIDGEADLEWEDFKDAASMLHSLFQLAYRIRTQGEQT